MTNKELQDLLKSFPDDIEVRIRSLDIYVVTASIKNVSTSSFRSYDPISGKANNTNTLVVNPNLEE